MFVVCDEHLDEVVDDFVEEFGEPPDLYSLEVTTFTQWAAPQTCQLCDRAPRYLVV
jgi:CxxH/CxxC protein (TIGR04129 family)